AYQSWPEIAGGDLASADFRQIQILLYSWPNDDQSLSQFTADACDDIERAGNERLKFAVLRHANSLTWHDRLPAPLKLRASERVAVLVVGNGGEPNTITRIDRGYRWENLN